MELYAKLKPLLEEYYQLNDEWWTSEAWRAVADPRWNQRNRELNERRQELQRQIQQLTQQDRTLVN